MNDFAIQLDKVSKRYILRPHRPFLMREMMRRLTTVGNKSTEDEFWALKDISFNVRKGTTVGIMGGNGAGKSTLLSLMIGSSQPTSGHIEIQGRVGALLELGAGFHQDLTGRENIVLNASLLGLSKAEIDEKMQDIIEFTELNRFIDVPIRNYSSGMHVRLGFSVAIHINPEILIVDEALSVGDAGFQEKCLQRIHDIKQSGVTFIIVSHSMNMLENLCDEVVWLEKGKMKMVGNAETVIPKYSKPPPKKN